MQKLILLLFKVQTFNFSIFFSIVKMANDDDSPSGLNPRFVKLGIFGAIIVGGVGLLLFIVLFPMSFSYLDFYEVTFWTNKNKNYHY